MVWRGKVVHNISAMRSNLSMSTRSNTNAPSIVSHPTTANEPTAATQPTIPNQLLGGDSDLQAQFQEGLQTQESTVKK